MMAVQSPLLPPHSKEFPTQKEAKNSPENDLQSRNRFLPVAVLGVLVVIFAGLVSLPAVWLRATRAEDVVALAKKENEKLHKEQATHYQTFKANLENATAKEFDSLYAEKIDSLTAEISSLTLELNETQKKYVEVRTQLASVDMVQGSEVDKLQLENFRLKWLTNNMKSKLATTIQENDLLKRQLADGSQSRLASVEEGLNTVKRIRIDQAVVPAVHVEECTTCACAAHMP